MTRDELTDDEQKVLAGIDHLLAEPSLWVDVDPALERHVIEAVLAEAGSAPVSSHTVRPVASRPRRWLTVAAAAAVGAAAALAATAVVQRIDEPTVDATMEMEGTSLVPGLHGTAEFTAQKSGVEIEVHMPGLPRRDGGEYYELWMHNCSGTAWVPAGTFHDMDYVVAWAGVSASDYPVLKVTEEKAGSPDGDGQAVSARVVAWGSLEECTA